MERWVGGWVGGWVTYLHAGMVIHLEAPDVLEGFNLIDERAGLVVDPFLGDEEEFGAWRGRWVGGWVGGWVGEKKAVRMSYCTPWWVGGWVGG